MVQVRKAGGGLVLFERKRIVRTCERAGLSKESAEKIAASVEAEVTEGMSTQIVFKKVLQQLDLHEATHSKKYKLKQAVAALDPEEHEFELYVTHLLRALGYTADWNILVEGECVRHQVDIFAEKDGERFLIECKHHRNPHRISGLDVSLETWASLDDVQKGYTLGKNKEKAERGWLITNTRFSAHAARYAKAKNMRLTGWKHPEKNDLSDLIESKSLYPLTILPMPRKDRFALAKADVLILKELKNISIDVLHQRTKIPRKNLEKYLHEARELCED